MQSFGAPSRKVAVSARRVFLPRRNGSRSRKYPIRRYRGRNCAPQKYKRWASSTPKANIQSQKCLTPNSWLKSLDASSSGDTITMAKSLIASCHMLRFALRATSTVSELITIAVRPASRDCLALGDLVTIRHELHNNLLYPPLKPWLGTPQS